MHPTAAQATLLVSFLWISQALAVVPRSPFQNGLVFPRQTVCDSACAVFTDALNGCTTNGCLCTSSVARGLQSCVDCAVDASPTADVLANAQDLVSTYTSQCAGFGLPPVTVKSGSGGPGPSSSIRTTVIVTPPTGTTTQISSALPSTTRTSPTVPTTTTPLITTPTISTPLVQTTSDLPQTTDIGFTPTISQSVIRPSSSSGSGVTGGPGQGIPNGLTGGGITTHGLANLGLIGISLLFCAFLTP